MIGGMHGAMNGGPRGLLEGFGDQKTVGRFNPRLVPRLISYLRPYRGRMAVAMMSTLVLAGLTLLAPYLLKVIIDGPLAKGNVRELALMCVALAAAYLGSYAATAIERYQLSWVGQRVLATLREKLFRHLQALHVGYHDTHVVGVTISRVINDVGTINDLLTQGLVSLAGDLVLLGGTIVIMVRLSPRLALLSFVVLPLMVAATTLFAAKAKAAFRDTRSTVAAVVGDLAENIAGMRVIQAFAREDESRARFDEANARNKDSHVRAMSLSFIFIPFIDFLGALAVAIVLWFGGNEVVGGAISLGTVVAFLSYVGRFFQPIRDLSQLYTMMQAAMAGGEKLFELLDTKPAIIDPEEPTGEPDRGERVSAREPPDGPLDLRFDRVGFAYIRGVPVLQDLSFHLPAGQVAAVVGPTGAGKSTIAALVLRFREADSGAVSVGGVDVRRISQQKLRGRTAYVPQDPFVFSGTILDNILYGRPDLLAEGGEAALAAATAAAALANVDRFVHDLPSGYESLVQEGGTNLSAGQRQLLCIARAVAVSPSLLILDEATSNVDPHTEALIQEALARVLRGRTALVIAHRLSTVRQADRILVIDGGRLVEDGTHDGLLARGRRYADLYRRQFLDLPPVSPS